MKTFLGNGIGVGMVQLGSNSNQVIDYSWQEEGTLELICEEETGEILTIN